MDEISFISVDIAEKKTGLKSDNCQIAIANASLSSQITGYTLICQELNLTILTRIFFFEMSNLYRNIIPGHDFLKKVNLTREGDQMP